MTDVMTRSDVLFSTITDAVEDAIEARIGADDVDSDVYVCDLTDTWAIFRVWGKLEDKWEGFWKVGYAFDGSTAALDGDPQAVEQTYTPTTAPPARSAGHRERRARMASAPARVKSEPRTYEPHKQVSFFRDLALSKLSDPGAHERLEAHRHEMAVEQRTNPSTTDGLGGEFAPPAWLIPLTGVGIAGPRVIADLIDKAGNLFDLPTGVDEVNVPRITTGAQMAVQNEGSADVDRDEATANTKSKVFPIAGESIVSQQLLDQTPAPGYDKILLKDLTAQYNATLEQQLVAGTGVGGQTTGLVNITNAVKVAAGSGIVPANLNGATPMISGLWFVLGSMYAQAANGRQQPLTNWVMAPRRWAAIEFSTDLQDLPLSANLQLPVGLSAALGPASNSVADTAVTDTILGIRPDDLLLWESAQPRFAAYQDPLAGTLQVRLQLRRYVAKVFGRYPSGIAAATGLVQPTTGLTGWTY